MFVFNLFYGIGHFELDLWKKQYNDPIVGRLENLEHDKKVNDWAYKKIQGVEAEVFLDLTKTSKSSSVS